MAVSFACKNIELSELIKCSFGLNKTEYTVLMSMLDWNELLRTEEIAAKLKLERSTVQKAVKKLVMRELVTRLQENLEKGGYAFKYHVKSKSAVKNMMLETVEKWNRSVKSEIGRW